MLAFGKWSAKSPFPLKSQIKYAHRMLKLIGIGQFCFQRSQKEFSTPVHRLYKILNFIKQNSQNE